MAAQSKPLDPTIQSVKDAVKRARNLLAKTQDPAERESARIQIEHLEFKLKRAQDGVYRKEETA